MSEQCQRCKAPICWGLTKAGKWMPLDAAPDPAGEWRLFGDTPRAVHVEPERRQELAAQLMTAHWATCPYADAFRRDRR